MQTKLLHSYSADTIGEYNWEKPEPRYDEIEVKTAFCGVCRSDIGSYARWENMPYTDADNPNGKLGGFGHEGLGTVTKIGSKVTNVKVGDYVATWGDPAYALYYNVKATDIAIIPSLEFKYILQPVACAINIAIKTLNMRNKLGFNGSIENRNGDVLLIGTGFMSIIIGQYFNWRAIPYTVVGSSNKEEWQKLGKNVVPIENMMRSRRKFSTCIDLSSKASTWNKFPDLIHTEGLICYAATPSEPITTNFFEACWNCFNFIMPSPRNLDFSDMMQQTADLVASNVIDPSFIWTKEYDRHDMDSVKEAFEDGKNRKPGYVRGYLKF